MCVCVCLCVLVSKLCVKVDVGGCRSWDRRGAVRGILICGMPLVDTHTQYICTVSCVNPVT